MHGNAPYADFADEEELSSEQITTLREDVATVSERTRALLPDEFIVGSELRANPDGTHGAVSVQPPVGQAISTGIPIDASEQEHDTLVHELAAGAALQVKRALSDVEPTAC